MYKFLLTIFFSLIIVSNVSSAQLEDYDLMSAGQIKREIINKNLFGYYHKSKKSFSEIYSSNKILTFKTEGKTYYAKWKFKGRRLCAKFNEESSYECVKVLKQQKNGKFYYFFANDDGVFAGATVVGSGAKISLKEKKSKDVVLKCSNKTNGTKSIIINEDENKIIRQYILANKQRLETYDKMRRLYDAVKVLGMRDPKIAEIFIRRNSKPLYQFIENNRFEPFSVTKNVIRDYAIMSKENNIPNPLNRRVLKQLKKIEKQLYKQRLNKDFIINEEDYLLPEPNTSMVPPLPEMPQPNVSVAQQTPNVMQTGLTPVETALLSEEEKMIALKNRGLV